MKALVDFTASAWVDILLAGFVIGVVFFGLFFAALEYQKWLIRRDMEKQNKADAQRYRDMAQRLKEK